MKRLIILALLILLPFSAAAQSTQISVVESMKQQGYELVSTEKSWLQRVVMNFESETHSREIIFDPTHGHIIRDYTEEKHEDDDGDHRPWYLQIFGITEPSENGSTGDADD